MTSPDGAAQIRQKTVATLESTSRVTTWRAVAAITASRRLRAELRVVEQGSGWDFEYTNSITHGRRFARHRPMIIVGADLVARVRRPLTCAGAVLVATVDVTDTRVFAHTARIAAAYLVVLPQGCPWLVDQLLQSHRWCGMPTPHPPVAIALAGTHLRPATGAFMGWFGPRAGLGRLHTHRPGRARAWRQEAILVEPPSRPSWSQWCCTASQRRRSQPGMGHGSGKQAISGERAGEPRLRSPSGENSRPRKEAMATGTSASIHR